MKYHIYICLCIYLTICGTQSYENRYKQLASQPGYKGDSYIEIAVKQSDFGAIRQFAFQSDLKDLIKARKQLQVKLDFLKDDIYNLHKEYDYENEVVSLAKKKQGHHKKNNLLHNALLELDTWIKRRQ